MKDIQEFSAVANWNRVKGGFKGGGFFENGSTRKPFNWVEGWPKESIQKFSPELGIQEGTPIDSWNERRIKNV